MSRPRGWPVAGQRGDLGGRKICADRDLRPQKLRPRASRSAPGSPKHTPSGDHSFTELGLELREASLHSKAI
jgi:hypothetical protein